MIILVLMSMSLMLILIGCSHSKQQTQKKDYKPEVLNVEFVPSQHSETLNAKVKPLQKLLSKELGIPVKVHISTNYNTMVEALKSKKLMSPLYHPCLILLHMIKVLPMYF